MDHADFDAVYQLDGSRQEPRWRGVRVKTLHTDEAGKELRDADAPWLGGHALVVSDPFLRPVAELLAGAGEFLELEAAEGPERLWLFNAELCAEALDEAASDLVRFPSTGRVMKVNRHVFRPEVVTDLVAFRIPQTRSLFLTGAVVDALNSLELSGAGFELLWQQTAGGRGRL